MTLLLDSVLIVILFFLFGYFHSLTASLKVKKIIALNFPSFMPFYRITYNIFSLLTFYLFIEVTPKPKGILYDLSYPFDLIIYALQLISLFGFFWVFKFLCFKEFIGVAQISRWFHGKYENELDENPTLIKEGPFKYSRHPIYLFSILFLLLRPTMSIYYFILFVCIVIYFYVGSYYEEKKLIEIFGKEYLDYKQITPKIFPRFFQ